MGVRSARIIWLSEAWVSGIQRRDMADLVADRQNSDAPASSPCLRQAFGGSAMAADCPRTNLQIWAGMKRSYLARIETGRSLVSLKFIGKLATALNAESAEFLGRPDSGSSDK
jgi:Helix-turn-helix domain